MPLVLDMCSGCDVSRGENRSVQVSIISLGTMRAVDSSVVGVAGGL